MKENIRQKYLTDMKNCCGKDSFQRNTNKIKIRIINKQKFLKTSYIFILLTPLFYGARL